MGVFVYKAAGLAALMALMAASSLASSLAEGAALTSGQQTQLDGFLKESGMAMPASPATHVALADQVKAVVKGADPQTSVHVATASAVTSIDTRATAPSPHSLLSVLTPGAQDANPAYGLTTGQGIAPALPVRADLDRQTAAAVLALYQAPNQGPEKRTAEQAASFAADETNTDDPAFDERIALARALFRVDGTDALIRHFVDTQHMRLIIAEVAKHIDFSKLSESDKYRLAAIAAAAQTDLEDKVLTLNARQQAQILTKPELLQLLAGFDIDAQRKLTTIRLGDNGKTDRAAELDLGLAQYQIVKQYEAGQ